MRSPAISWGVLATLLLFVRTPLQFYVVRFLLGVAEAGFFPGMIFYLTCWFPRAYRARTVSLFMVAAVLSYVVGGPLSGWLMDHPHLGLQGWQWLFLVEGVPSLVLGVVVFFHLPDGPQTARMAVEDEAAWLTSRLAVEQAEQERYDRFTLGQALISPRVLLLSLVYFLGVTGALGSTSSRHAPHRRIRV
jgi:ACS family tartrate transporter-like MFS transporter